VGRKSIDSQREKIEARQVLIITRIGGFKMLYKDTSAIEAVIEGRDIPSWIFIGSNRVAKIKYIHTSGWRGYHEATATKKHGWAKVKDGWMTGDWDDAPTEARGSNVEAAVNALAKENDARGYDTLIVFLPTSNVFSTAYDVFEKARGKIETVKRRKLANNTYLIDNGKRRAVRLHSTDILTEIGPGRLRVDTGGWDTMTTRDRLERFSNLRVWRDKGITYVDGHKLRDGMTIAGTLDLEGSSGRSTAYPRQ
jgi:hypothetical protein